tara:strand:- start:401 stop:544 length:144 start_codon:yes stop_codon:yes gene_type:complete
MTIEENSKKYSDITSVIACPAKAIILINKKSEELTNKSLFLFSNLDI